MRLAKIVQQEAGIYSNTVHCFKFPKNFSAMWRCEPVPNGNWPKHFGVFSHHCPGDFRCQIVSLPKYFGDLFSM